jgi:hypothetical protein
VGYDPWMSDDAGPEAGLRDDLVRWLDQHDAPAIRMITDGALLRALRAIPGTVSISGTTLQISAFLWRDFMPISLPGGHPLIARVWVSTAATAILPAIRADRIAVISGEQAWIASVAEGTAEERRGSHLEVIARDGPMWGPGILADIVLELRDTRGQAHLIRVPDEEIHRTD